MSLEIIEVKTKKHKKDFLQFPLDLYKGNENFVPPLWGDEAKCFKKSFVYRDTCEIVCYNAYEDGRMVGRIMGILQKASNEVRGEKRIRFSRFDSVDDEKVAKALFDAVEKWALSKGMDTVCGPLGFSDLEREGLLIEGFDKLSTFEEQYNFPYYQKLIENAGYEKEVDWIESMIFPPEEDDGTLEKMSDFIMKRYNLHFGTARSTNDFLNKYSKGFFELLDKSYKNIYGTVPFTENMKKNMIDNFRLIIDLDHVAVILDENEKVVCFGICFASIAKAVQKSNGHLTPGCIVRVLRSIKNPEVIDLGLIGVDPEWANRGVSTLISAELLKMLKKDGVHHAETNLNLEDNMAIRNQWKRFKAVQHKRRRAFVKVIGGTDD